MTDEAQPENRRFCKSVRPTMILRPLKVQFSQPVKWLAIVQKRPLARVLVQRR